MSELVDAQTDLRANKGPARHEVLIAGADLHFEEFGIADPVPTGRQIIEAFTREDASTYVVLQWLANGMLEELRLDETTKLREPGKERFIVVRSDRSFRIEIAGERQEWPCAIISGATLKRLGGQDADKVDVFMGRQGEADALIEDDQIVSLGGREVERFYFKPRPKEVEIFVNRKSVHITRGDHTGSEIKQAAIDAGVKIQPDFVLSLELGPGETRIIGDNETVTVKKGQRYVAVADDDNS